MHENQTRLVSFIILFFVTCFAHADIYKCETQGKITLNEHPCPSDQKQLSLQINPPSSSDQTNAIATKAQIDRDKTKVEVMRRERIRQEQKYDTEIRRQSAKTQKRQALCDKARLQMKWAREDKDSASPKSADKAQKKYARSKEKADMACKPT